MNMITREARKRQAVVKYAIKERKSRAGRRYGVSLSSVKRWCERYDGESRQSLAEKSHRPHSCPTQRTRYEEKKSKKAFKEYYGRYGWKGVYDATIWSQSPFRPIKNSTYSSSVMGFLTSSVTFSSVSKNKSF